MEETGGRVRLRILNVAYPFAPVRLDTAGGAEQVVAMLDRALCDAGHESLVVACEGSKVRGELLATPDPEDRLDLESQRRIHEACRETILHAIERYQPDLIHLHGVDFFEYVPPPGPPVLATLHLPPSWYKPAVFSMERANTWLHCVSKSQEDACPNVPTRLPFIANGVSEDLIRPEVRKNGFALALGRICPEKGFHLALEAAHLAKVPFLLAGKTYAFEEHQRYFEQEIVPRLGPCSRFIGPIGLGRKRRLLTAAHCVLIPSLAPETSSLVAMEAAMCGTPVIAFRSGALPEVVEDGVTGFLVGDARQMSAAIGECNRIDPVRCREEALRRFSERCTAAAYLGTYERLIRQSRQS